MRRHVLNKSKLWLIVSVCFALIVSVPLLTHAYGKGVKSSDVYALQGMLKTLGYYSGDINGKYDSMTTEAVKKYQTKHSLGSSGTLDERTLQSILSTYGHKMRPGLKVKSQAFDGGSFGGSFQPSAGTSQEESQMVTLVNEARTQAGQKPLTVDPQLTGVARTKSTDMATNNYFSHDSPTYGSPFDMMGKFGITFRSAGENIACNQNVQAAHEALMNSEGHRRNILDGTFTHIGIGISDGGPCGKMYTQEFISK